VRYIFLVRIAS